MTITSSAFKNDQTIPPKYTCEGDNQNPPLDFSQVPLEAKSLLLILEDPDAPMKTFTHWVVYNIIPTTTQILENQVPKGSNEGLNGAQKVGYVGPCPPSGVHRYYFRLFALDSEINLPDGAPRQDIDDKIKGHVIDTAELVGLYGKSNG